METFVAPCVESIRWRFALLVAASLLAFSPIVFARQVVPAAGPRITWDRGHLESLFDVVPNSDGARALTVSRDGVGLWSTRDGARIAFLRSADGDVQRAEFGARDDRILVVSRNGVGLWDGLSGDLVDHWKGPENGRPCDARFVAAGERILLAVGDVVELRDTDGRLVAPLHESAAIEWWDHWEAEGLVATADAAGIVSIWDARSGVVNVRLKDAPAKLADARHTQELSRLVTWHVGGVAILWDLATGRRIADLRESPDDHVWEVRLLPGDERIAVVWLRQGSPTRLAVLDASDGRRLWSKPLEFAAGGGVDSCGVFSIDVSSDGARIVAATARDRVAVFDADDGNELGTWSSSPAVLDFDHRPCSRADPIGANPLFVDEGRAILVAVRNESGVVGHVVLHASDAAPIAALTSKDDAAGVVLRGASIVSSDSRRLFRGVRWRDSSVPSFVQGGAVRTAIEAWDLAAARRIASIDLTRKVEMERWSDVVLEVSPDDRWLWVDDVPIVACAISVETGEVREVERDSSVQVVRPAFARARGRTVAKTVTSEGAGWLDLDDRSVVELPATLAAVPALMRRNSDGSRLIVGSTPVVARMWDCGDGTLLANLAEEGRGVRWVAFDPFGDRVVSVATKFDVADGTQKLTGHHVGLSIRETLHGTLLGAVECADQFVDHLTWTDLDADHAVVQIAGPIFTPARAGRVAESSGRSLVSWLVASRDGDFVRTLVSPVDATSVNSEADRFATWRTGCRQAELYRLSDGTHVAMLDHASDVSALEVVPDGDRFVSTTVDGHLEIWSAIDGRQVGDVQAHDGPVPVFEISRDGRSCITASPRSTQALRWMNGMRAYSGAHYAAGDEHGDGILRRWSLPDLKPVFTLPATTPGLGGALLLPPDDRIVRTTEFRTSDHALHRAATILSGDGSVVAQLDGRIEAWMTAPPRVLLSDGNELRLLAGDSLETLATLRGRLVGRAPGPPSAIGRLWTREETSMHRWDPVDGKEIASFELDANERLDSIGADGRLFTSKNNLLFTRSEKSGQIVHTIVLFPDAEWFAFTPTLHYVGTPAAIDRMRLEIDGVSYPLATFESLLHRSDVVAKALKGEVGERVVLSTPPRIEIVSPKGRDATVERDLFDFEVRITDRYGIEGVALAQDGVAIAADRLDAGTESDPLRREVRIRLPGRVAASASATTFEISAANRRGMRSTPVRVTVRRKAVERDLYLLALGVSHYEDRRLELTAPALDVKSLVRTFVAQEGVAYRAVHVHELLDQELTSANVKKERAKFLTEAQPQDTIVVFAAAHATRDSTGDYYLLTSDANAANPYAGIERELLESLVTSPRLLATRRLLLIDTCYAGQEFEGVARSDERGGGPLYTEKELDSFVDRSKSGVYVFAATSAKSEARETRQNGVFTKAVVEGLEGAADGDHDGIVSVVEMMQYARAAVSRATDGAQRPQMPRAIGEDFPLVRVRK